MVLVVDGHRRTGTDIHAKRPRGTENPRVAGSIPALGTRHRKQARFAGLRNDQTTPWVVWSFSVSGARWALCCLGRCRARGTARLKLAEADDERRQKEKSDAEK